MGHVGRRASFASLRAPFQEPILRRIIDTFHLRAIKLGNKDEFDDVDEFTVLGSNEVKVTRYCVKVTFIYFYW